MVTIITMEVRTVPRLKKIPLVCVKLNVRTILIVFFSCQSLVHYEFSAGGQTVNQKIYLTIWSV